MLHDEEEKATARRWVRRVMLAVLIGCAAAVIGAIKLSAPRVYRANAPGTISFPSLSRVGVSLAMFAAGLGIGATAVVLGAVALVRRPRSVTNSELLWPVFAMVLGLFGCFVFLRRLF